jgi:DNA-binding transcriptional LysR family regulator
MFLNKINLNQLRIFETVYRTKSMTVAAHELHLTQSGVSQHMKALEDALGVRLFDRIKQRLVPTAAAATLFAKCTASFEEIERALAKISGKEAELSGTVMLGMPIEFGNNIILPMLARFSERHPQVRYELRLGFASEMNDLLIRGEADFAFIDNFTVDRRITTDPVFDEILDLCIHPELLKKFGPEPTREQKKYFEKMPYVEYQRGSPVIRMWFAHHLGTRHLEIDTVTTVMDVQAIAQLIRLKTGAGVLPHHLVSKLKDEGHEIHSFRGCGKPVKNEISVAYLRERSHTSAAKELLNFLKAELKELAGAPRKKNV